MYPLVSPSFSGLQFPCPSLCFDVSMNSSSFGQPHPVTEELFLSFYVDRSYGWATLRKGSQLWEKIILWTPERTQASALVPFLKELLEEAHQDPLHIRGLAAPCGPTSFTTLRLTLTVAKSWAFAVPRALTFSPTQFHVLAFAVHDQVPPQTDLLVILDSFKQGFYASVVRLLPQGWPCMQDSGAFYNEAQGQAFLERYASLPWITNCPPQAAATSWFKTLAQPPLKIKGSLSTAQLSLWDLAQFRPQQDHEQRALTQFRPFYGHTPDYVKTTSQT